LKTENDDAPAAPPEIPNDEGLRELTAAQLMDLADAHGLPQSPNPAHNLARLTAVRDGTDMPNFAEPEPAPAPPASIPGDADLDGMTDDEVFHLARSHQVPYGEDPSRESDIAGLKIKRDGGIAVTEEGVVVTDVSGIPMDLPPIQDDETLNAMDDQALNDLATAHGIEVITRAQSIDALIAKRDSLVVITPVPSDQEIAGLDEVQLRDLASRHGIETTNRVYADVLADLRAKRDLDAEAAQQ